MTRWAPLLVLAGALLMAGCTARSSGLNENELRRVAWYVEDVAHGLPRSPDELRYSGGSTGLERIAQWAQGDQRDGQMTAQPEPLRSRRARWALLSQALAADRLRYGEQGTLHPVEHSDAVDDLLADAVRQEHLDRMATVDILLGQGNLRPDSARAAALVRILGEARSHHAAAAGGHQWAPPSTSTSDPAATTSTSEPEPWRRREP